MASNQKRGFRSNLSRRKNNCGIRALFLVKIDHSLLSNCLCEFIGILLVNVKLLVLLVRPISNYILLSRKSRTGIAFQKITPLTQTWYGTHKQNPWTKTLWELKRIRLTIQVVRGELHVPPAIWHVLQWYNIGVRLFRFQLIEAEWRIYASIN